jgi:hypothetical protein
MVLFIFSEMQRRSFCFAQCHTQYHPLILRRLAFRILNKTKDWVYLLQMVREFRSLGLWMFANCWGGPIDKSEARKFHEVACSGEHAEACFALGLMLQKGDGGEKDEAEARQTLLSACRLCSLDGCAELVVMTINGVGGPASVQEGMDKLKEACEQSGALACGKLADFWSTTGLEAKDDKHAEKYRVKACELGHKPSCALKMR